MVGVTDGEGRRSMGEVLCFSEVVGNILAIAPDLAPNMLTLNRRVYNMLSNTRDTGPWFHCLRKIRHHNPWAMLRFYKACAARRLEAPASLPCIPRRLVQREHDYRSIFYSPQPPFTKEKVLEYMSYGIIAMLNYAENGEEISPWKRLPTANDGLWLYCCLYNALADNQTAGWTGTVECCDVLYHSFHDAIRQLIRRHIIYHPNHCTPTATCMDTLLRVKDILDKFVPDALQVLSWFSYLDKYVLEEGFSPPRDIVLTVMRSEVEKLLKDPSLTWNSAGKSALGSVAWGPQLAGVMGWRVEKKAKRHRTRRPVGDVLKLYSPYVLPDFLRLTCADGTLEDYIDVNKEEYENFSSIVGILESCPSTVQANGSEVDTVPLLLYADCTMNTMKEILRYIHIGLEEPYPVIRKPLPTTIEQQLSPKYRAYYKEKLAPEEGHHLIVEIISAVNFIGFRPLLDLCCAGVACMMRGKTPEQIQAAFRITPDHDNPFMAVTDELLQLDTHGCRKCPSCGGGIERGKKGGPTSHLTNADLDKVALLNDQHILSDLDIDAKVVVLPLPPGKASHDSYHTAYIVTPEIEKISVSHWLSQQRLFDERAETAVAEALHSKGVTTLGRLIEVFNLPCVAGVPLTNDQHVTLGHGIHEYLARLNQIYHSPAWLGRAALAELDMHHEVMEEGEGLLKGEAGAKQKDVKGKKAEKHHCNGEERRHPLEAEEVEQLRRREELLTRFTNLRYPPAWLEKENLRRAKLEAEEKRSIEESNEARMELLKEIEAEERAKQARQKQKEAKAKKKAEKKQREEEERLRREREAEEEEERKRREEEAAKAAQRQQQEEMRVAAEQQRQQEAKRRAEKKKKDEERRKAEKERKKKEEEERKRKEEERKRKADKEKKLREEEERRKRVEKERRRLEEEKRAEALRKEKQLQEARDREKLCLQKRWSVDKDAPGRTSTPPDQATDNPPALLPAKNAASAMAVQSEPTTPHLVLHQVPPPSDVRPQVVEGAPPYHTAYPIGHQYHVPPIAYIPTKGPHPPPHLQQLDPHAVPAMLPPPFPAPLPEFHRGNGTPMHPPCPPHSTPPTGLPDSSIQALASASKLRATAPPFISSKVHMEAPAATAPLLKSFENDPSLLTSDDQPVAPSEVDLGQLLSDIRKLTDDVDDPLATTLLGVLGD